MQMNHRLCIAIAVEMDEMSSRIRTTLREVRRLFEKRLWLVFFFSIRRFLFDFDYHPTTIFVFILLKFFFFLNTPPDDR